MYHKTWQHASALEMAATSRTCASASTSYTDALSCVWLSHDLSK